jgi:REP element-mobilizing transposase RayT
MPQSLSRVLVHLVFSTKNRAPLLSLDIQRELHPYLCGVLGNLGCTSLRVGGVGDHVHILLGLSRTKTIANVVEELKTASSKWLKNFGPEMAEFHWQHGYGAFSVSQSDADRVEAYILEQSQHHQRMTFQEEYRRLLERHHIDFDERYVWD